jgi:cytochrome c biogenesis protein
MGKYFSNLFNFLASITVTIFVLSAIVVLVILQVSGIYLQSIAKDWQWLRPLVFIDFSRSPILIGLLVLFSINLIACCIKQLKRMLKILKIGPLQLDDTIINSAHYVEEFSIQDLNPGIEKLSNAIAAHFAKPLLLKDARDHHYFYAEKGKYVYLGFYLAHLSILALLIGVILSTQGYTFYVEIAKNKIVDPIVGKNNSNKRQVLNFGLACEDFGTVYYEGTKDIKKHQSTISIIKNGKKVKTQIVDFGNPLQYSGIDIYQNRITAKTQFTRLTVTAKNGEKHICEVKNGDSIRLPGSDIWIEVIGSELNSTSPPARIWISSNPSRFTELGLRDYQFSLLEIFMADTTSLKIMKDPGMEIIWYSFLSMALGFSVIFFFSHQRVWAKIEEKKSGCFVTMAGFSNKNQQALRKIITTVKNEMEGSFHA